MLVVNTCAFIDRAKQESIDAILEMAEHKKNGNCSRLVVTGCLAERYREELKEQIPEIDAVLGTGEVPEILGAIGSRRPWCGIRDLSDGTKPLRLFRSADLADPVPQQPDRESRIADPGPRSAAPTYIYDAETPRLLTTPKHYAYVKIAEGCDYTCAFCIIPTLRGHYRSRPARSIVREARALAARGVKELLLISQDTTFYGIDRGERGALGRLLRELNAVDGLEWIRLLYLYPTTITDDVLEAMAECEKVCSYIDLPLQHASAAVLKRMRRPGNRKTYDTLLAPHPRRGCRASRCARRSSSASRARPKRTSRSSTASSRDTRLRSRRRLHLFARGGHPRLCGSGRCAGGGEAAAADALMALQKRIVAQAQKARIGQTSCARSTARPPSTTWCCRDGSRARRPTSTRWST